jgi:hypothetical protein
MYARLQPLLWQPFSRLSPAAAALGRAAGELWLKSSSLEAGGCLQAVLAWVTGCEAGLGLVLTLQASRLLASCNCWCGTAGRPACCVVLCTGTHWDSHGLNLLLHLHLGGLGNSGHSHSLNLLLSDGSRGSSCALGDGDNSLSTLGDCEGACVGQQNNNTDKQAAGAGSMDATGAEGVLLHRCCCVLGSCTPFWIHRCHACAGRWPMRHGCSKSSSRPDKSLVCCTLMLSCHRWPVTRRAIQLSWR